MNKKVFNLAWPIFIEIALFMLMGNVDVIMLSRYNSNAVAAVGNVNQLFSLIGLLFSVVTSATAVLVGQYIGAKKEKELGKVITVAITMNFIFSFLVSAFVLLGAEKILALINVPLEIRFLAIEYMNIVGGFLFIHALSLTLTAVIKSSGNTRPVMYMALVMNILNVIGNYTFLFGPFGLPVLGVKGVAIATAFSRLLAFLFYFMYVKKVLKINLSFSLLSPFPKDVVKKVLSLGLPSALEPFSYQFTQVVIIGMVNTFGLIVINTRVYVMSVTWLVYLAVLALSQASQILVAQLVGAFKFDDAKVLVIKSLKISLGVAFFMSLNLIIFGEHIIRIFTSDEAVIALAKKIFIVDFFVEMGRVFNLVIISSAKGAGDVKFPAFLGVVSMWSIATGIGYILGVYFELGLLGIWIAMAIDEWLRGLIMLKRWLDEKWKKYYIV